MLRHLLGGCDPECRNGTFCDNATGNCEPCVDICQEGRDTMEECLAQPSCQAWWPRSPETDSTTLGITSSPGSETNTALIALSVSAIVILLAVFVVFLILKRTGRLKTTRLFDCIHPKTTAVQVSEAAEQLTERLNGSSGSSVRSAAATVRGSAGEALTTLPTSPV